MWQKLSKRVIIVAMMRELTERVYVDSSVVSNRIRQYNGINMVLGYSQIEIRTPDEVIQ